MTNEEALEEATKRWGSNARLAWEPSRLNHKTPLGPYIVGDCRGNLGIGRSWEEAFYNVNIET